MTEPPKFHGRFDVFVDSGGFYASFVPKDEYHAEALDFLRRAAFQGLRLCTSNFVVVETHALLLNRAGHAVALEFLRSMQSGQTYIERVTVEDEDDAIAIIERYQDKDFSFTDASSFVVMQRLGIRVALAFDRHFTQFGFAKATD